MGNPNLEKWVNKVHCMDCLEGMKQLPDGCVDLVVTDPPYKDEDVPIPYYEWLRIVFDEMQRIARDYILMFNNANRLYDILTLFGRPYRILIWTKGIVKYSWRWEPIFIYQLEAQYKMNGRIWSDHLPCQPLHKAQSCHPYEKPQKLISQLVSFSNEDDLILDPFMGSGTTAVACKQLGRRFIGFEINPDYVKICNQRLAQEVLL